MPYCREDDGLPIATITYALVFIYKATTHTFTHFILYYTKILEVNLFAFAYRLFRRDFSPLDGTYCMGTHSLYYIMYLWNHTST